MRKYLTIWLLLPIFALAAEPTHDQVLSGSDSTQDTNHDVALPLTGNAVGDVFVCAIGGQFVGSPGYTWPAGWTEIYDSGSNLRLGVAWRESDAGESSPIVVTTTQSSKSATACWRWDDADDPDTEPPVASTGTTYSASSAPDWDSLTHGFTCTDFGSMIFGGHAGGPTITFDTPPTGYTNSGEAAPSPANANLVFWASDTITGAASEDPGAGTLSATETGNLVTLAVPGICAGGASSAVQRRRHDE